METALTFQAYGSLWPPRLVLAWQCTHMVRRAQQRTTGLTDVHLCRREHTHSFWRKAGTGGEVTCKLASPSEVGPVWLGNGG